MKLRLYSLAVVLTLGVLVLINIASGLPAQPFQGITPTPTAAAANGNLPSPGPAGSTNGITFLGILIFIVIVFAVVSRLRDLRAKEQRP